MARFSAIICLLLLGIQLIPLSIAQSPHGSDNLVESESMFLNQESLLDFEEDNDTFWQPKLTAPHPEGGLVALFQTDGNGTLSFGSSTFSYNSTNSNIPGGNFSDDCYNNEVFILAWLNDEGEWNEIRQLDFSSFPINLHEGTYMDGYKPCHNLYDVGSIAVRDDGLIGIIFSDSSDWDQDYYQDSEGLIIGYYQFHFNGIPNINSLLFDWGVIWEKTIDWEADHYWDVQQELILLDFFGNDRVVFTYGCYTRCGWSGDGYGGHISTMVIGADGTTDGVAEEYPSGIPAYSGVDGSLMGAGQITSLQCIDVTCIFTSTNTYNKTYFENISATGIDYVDELRNGENGETRAYVFTSNLIATSILEYNLSEINAESLMFYDAIIGADGSYYISGNMVVDHTFGMPFCGINSIEPNTIIGFVISLNTNFSIKWESCSLSGKAYPSQMSINDYGDIALLGRYDNANKWDGYENIAASGGFILIMDNSTGDVTHVQETGDRIEGGCAGCDDWIRKDRIFNAGNGEFWWPFYYEDEYVFTRIGMDNDSDDITNYRDNCPETANPSQLDSDSDGFGDDCDSFTSDVTQWSDIDGDGFGDNSQGNQPDSCPSVSGTSDEDRNGCPDRDGDGWSDPDEFWTFEEGADQEPDDSQSHVDTTPTTVGFNWQVADEDDQGGNLIVQITWSNSDWSGLTEANAPDTLQIFASAERWDDCSILQMVLEMELDSQSEPPTSLLIGNLTNDVEYTVCIAISDINNNEVVKGPEYVTPTMNQPPEYTGGLTAQNVDYGDSWKIDLCVYFTDEETDCGNMTFTPSTNKISINTQELTAEWVPTASDNILENITISATDGKGSTVESNIFTIEVKVQASGDDVLFTLEVPIMGEVAITSEQLIGTLGSILAFGGTMGIAVIKLRSRRGKEKLVKRLSDEISDSKYSEELDELMEEVEDSLNNRKISDDQYSTLSIKINSARTRLSNSPSPDHDYNMPNDPVTAPPQYPPMKAPAVSTPNVNMRGKFDADGYETIEYPSGSNNWFYRDNDSGQWMVWE